MMYNSKLVASIKANSKLLREYKDTVYIPFGSEYEISIKNLNTVRAVVNVFIDGEDQTPDGLVVNAGQSIDLERSIKNGNLKAGNKFKFIERTGAIEQHRGIKLEDGIVEIRYQFEKPRNVLTVNPGWTQTTTTWTSQYPNTVDKFTLTAAGATSQMNVGGVLRGIDYSKGQTVQAQATSAINNYCAQNNISTKSEMHDGAATMDCCFNDAGITVAGSRSTQSFTTVTMGDLEAEKHTIVLKLLGETPDNKPVVKAVTVKAKPKCGTCGKQNKAHAKFCAECGTALTIFA